MGGINHRLFDIYPLRRRNRTKKKFYAFIIIYHLLIYVYFDTVVYICKKNKIIFSQKKSSYLSLLCTPMEKKYALI